MSNSVSSKSKSCSINSIYNISKFTNYFRINGSHNSMEWHIKISKRIKEICPESFILLDIPGLKPRTNTVWLSNAGCS